MGWGRKGVEKIETSCDRPHSRCNKYNDLVTD